MHLPCIVIPLRPVEPVDDEMGKRVDNGCLSGLGNLVDHRCKATDGAIRECLDARKDPNLGEIPALKNALKAGQWQGDLKRDIALCLRDRMQTAKKWKESTQAKKPEKDGDYQDTLLVQSWIAGK